MNIDYTNSTMDGILDTTGHKGDSQIHIDTCNIQEYTFSHRRAFAEKV